MPLTISAPQSSAALTADVSSGAAFSPSTAKVNATPAKNLVAGTAATQVAKIHSAQYLVNTSGATSIDLTAAADPASGAAQNFAKVSRILISNESNTPGENLTVFGGTNGLVAASPFVIGPGGHLKVDLGDQEITVDGTHKIITIAAAAGAAVPTNVTVFGR